MAGEHPTHSAVYISKSSLGAAPRDLVLEGKGEWGAYMWVPLLLCLKILFDGQSFPSTAGGCW